MTTAVSIYALLDARTTEILERRRSAGGLRRRGWLVRRALLTADLLGLACAFLAAELPFRGRAIGADHLGQSVEYALFLLALPVWVVVAKLYGLYDKDEERTDHSTADDFAGVFHLVTVITWLLYATSRISGVAHPEYQKLLVFWAVAATGIPLARAAGRAYCRRQIEYLQNTVIVGAGEVGQMIGQKIIEHPEYGLNLVGFVDSDPRDRRSELGHVAHLGDANELPSLVRMLDIERVVIAFSGDSHQESLELARDLRAVDVQVDIVPRLFETVGPTVGIHMVEGLPLVGLPPQRLSRSSALLKRVMDCTLSALGLLIFSPLLLCLAIAIRLDSRGPILYRHARLGQAGRDIDVLKFRTMKLESCRGERYGGVAAEEMFNDLLGDPENAAEFAVSYKLRNDPRVTRVGKLLRRTSLDELPQLLNVIRGDLSLVGPRAITNNELGRYGDDVDELLGVRPGITGYWQVNGRSQLVYEDRVRLDISYIRNWSLGLDLKILARTVRVLLSRRGAV